MISFEVNDRKYQSEKLNAIAQFHVMRRISPLLPTLVPIFVEMAGTDPDKKLTVADFAKLATLAGPLADGLAGMSDKDAEFVLTACLTGVKVENEGKFVPFWNATARKSMFEDMNDVGIFLPVAVKVIQENLSGFFQGLLMSEQSEATPTA